MSSSRSSYGSSYGQDTKGFSSSPRSSTSSYSATSSSTRSTYTNSASSSRPNRYSNKPPVVHNGGGQSNDPNTSTSAPNSGYYN
ncbi:hypothetical protein P154DRAFT_522306 [Amniculicola lignicola CBS 123094]|uniref:Uncharacterized protein n=1 Tax=Amniculicola lignicola CBS 123094 TaxID=1392246 RepID=A0A6A5WGE4_9PLEO|nr:hypothetical protein P154DRAFT_522306 [Amniculicola lignicola CBS 123094]